MADKKLDKEQQLAFLEVLQQRFEKHKNRHETISWESVKSKLEAQPEKIWSLYQMETTGGEPDVIALKKGYVFMDCAPESPKGRRSVCYDRESQESRKEHRPENNAIDMATAMGISILTEELYRQLQQFGNFDQKTSSWLHTPDAIRELGGAIFADFRYGQVFVYHNGAQSYYAARGFRGYVLLD